jgi:hypothetical protein
MSKYDTLVRKAAVSTIDAGEVANPQADIHSQVFGHLMVSGCCGSLHADAREPALRRRGNRSTVRGFPG